MYIHLHTHSDGSPQDGAQTIETIVKTVKAHGQTAVAVTDHGRCGSLLRLKQVCEKNEVKPIYGFESYVAPTSHLLKEKVEDHKTSYHLTLLAENETGLANIFKLCSLGWIEGYYYKARISMDLLSQYSEGIVVLSGCGYGRVSQMFLNDRPEEAEGHLLALRNIFKDRLYVEVQNHGIDYQQPLKKFLFELSDKHSIPIVATQDAHYSKREDADLHKYICKIAAGDLSFDCDQLYLKTEDEMKLMFEPEEHHAIYRTPEVAERCNCNWQVGKTIWPVYTKTDDPFRLLSTLAKNKLNELFNRNVPPEYSDRLNYELSTIKQMGFATYFLVVQDFINWAKKNGVGTGSGRGSAAGSIVCYALGITEVDPIRYGLYFERFLNPSRVSLPDCDTDFDPVGRKRVLEYVKSKYGTEKVAQIGTYAVFKPRGALRDFARAMEFGYDVGDKLASLIPPAVSGIGLSFDDCIKAEPKLLRTEYPEIVNMARRAEGLKKQSGVHAAGVVISDKDISYQIPLLLGNHDEVATQFDMHDVEDYGLVKYDFLGLKNLSVIRDTVDLVKKHQKIDINIEKIDMEDQRVYQEIFCKGRLDGVFQFETSSGLRDLCMQAQPRSIEDLAALNALFRPGPLATGLVDKYVAVRNGASPEYLIPELEPILKVTSGVMTYQEQIMRICTDIAGYTLSEADNMRKIIGKKKIEEMKVERGKFVSGCVKNKVDESIAQQLFDDIEGFAAYSFCLAHATAYSFTSYKTAWLKRYYPHEFYTALLNSSLDDQADIIKYMYAANEDGITVLPPDVNHSDTRFTLDNGTILFGLVGIKGIGDKACESLINGRPEDGFKSLSEFLRSGVVNAGVIKALAESGALSSLEDMPRARIVANISNLLEYELALKEYEEKEILVAEREAARLKAITAGEKPPSKLRSKKKPEPPVLDDGNSISKLDLLAMERKTLGSYVTGHPLDSFPSLSKGKVSVRNIIDGDVKDKSMVSLPVVISSITEKRTRSGKNMAVLQIEDKTGRIEATVFNKVWLDIKDRIQEDMVIMTFCAIDRQVVGDGDEEHTIVRTILRDIGSTNFKPEIAETICFGLEDGTKVEFVPGINVDVSTWKQGKQLISSIRRV